MSETSRKVIEGPRYMEDAWKLATTLAKEVEDLEIAFQAERNFNVGLTSKCEELVQEVERLKHRINNEHVAATLVSKKHVLTLVLEAAERASALPDFYESDFEVTDRHMSAFAEELRKCLT